MVSIRNWLKPTLVAIGLVATLSGCIAYVGPGGGGPRWHEHYYYR